ncbi:hypothetical protein HW555_008172 [Spodoptera exigua]|uniref:Uncharacterized protein n=1 Tax=Spodoptera exigua TaxID=7107 RepID=A0A835L304_SPOEX|nr:hypothetical protein HW555_008172 [Spodoptera exigua]
MNSCLSTLFIYDNDTACWFGLVGITDCVCWSVGTWCGGLALDNETIDVASANFDDDDTSVDVTLPSSSTPNTKNISNDDSQIQEIRENSVHSPKIQFFNEAVKKRKQEMQLKQPALASCFERSSSFEVFYKVDKSIVKLHSVTCRPNQPTAFANSQAEANRQLVESLMASHAAGGFTATSSPTSSSTSKSGNMSKCTARFDGQNRDPEIVESFIDSIEMYKECALVNDDLALRGLPMLLHGEAACKYFLAVSALGANGDDDDANRAERACRPAGASRRCYVQQFGGKRYDNPIAQWCRSAAVDLAFAGAQINNIIKI